MAAPGPPVSHSAVLSPQRKYGIDFPFFGKKQDKFRGNSGKTKRRRGLFSMQAEKRGRFSAAWLVQNGGRTGKKAG